MLKKVGKEILRILCLLFASAVYSFSITNFFNPAGLLAGGFTGLSLLIQHIFSTFLNIDIAFTLIYIPLNLIPAIISFKFIGKKFTVYSLIVIVATSVFTDIIPDFHLTDDILLCAVFGGIISGVSTAICLLSKATTGGTDFISIFISERYGKDAWGYIFMGNVVILVCSGLLFGWTSALYSIILQFAATTVIQAMYKHYQKQTLFIITDKPQEVYEIIKECTNHDGTLFKGIGLYGGKEKNMVYSVVSSDEIRMVISKIRSVDSKAFINVTKSEEVQGRFYYEPNK